MVVFKVLFFNISRKTELKKVQKNQTEHKYFFPLNLWFIFRICRRWRTKRSCSSGSTSAGRRPLMWRWPTRRPDQRRMMEQQRHNRSKKDPPWGKNRGTLQSCSSTHAILFCEKQIKWLARSFQLALFLLQALFPHPAERTSWNPDEVDLSTNEQYEKMSTRFVWSPWFDFLKWYLFSLLQKRLK